MIDVLLFALTLFAALGCGLIAGLFFAFSTFVMKALARLPPAQGIAAMQSINVTILRSLFMPLFFGTAAACIALAVAALAMWQEPGAGFLLAGGVLYPVGTVLVTIAFNVPLNNALAAAEPGGADSASLWTRYVVNWTAWNHVRTLAALAAAASLTVALRPLV